MNSHRYGEVSAVLDWSEDRLRRVLTAIVEADIRVPALDPAADLSSAQIDSVQAAMLRRDLSLRRRRRS